MVSAACASAVYIPGLSSTFSVMESPTGCTKQLISVLCRSVPAALLTRPAGMKPCCMAHKNSCEYFLRSLGSSTWARAVATRVRTWVTEDSSPLAYFSSSTSVEITCGSARAMAALSRCCIGNPFNIFEPRAHTCDRKKHSHQISIARTGTC